VLAILEMKATAIDQHRSTLTVLAGIQNPRSADILLLKPTLCLGSGGYGLGTIQLDGDIAVAAFTESNFELQFGLDTRILDQNIPGFRELSTANVNASLVVTARVQLDATGQPTSGLVDLHAETESQVRLIREPDLRILAINLVKHELINVILEVILEVSNPNAFPLEFDQLDYDFFGEGKRWSKGRERKTLQIPAKGTASTKIPVLLNFTEMDRHVFDLVEKLQVLDYLLSGTATVRTGLDFLPEFKMGFERPGSVKVERSLSRR